MLTDTVTHANSNIERPKKFTVVLHNDDTTPMDFVVYILIDQFNKTHEEAVELMMDSHTEGKTVVNLYTREIAEEKVFQVRKHAAANSFQLMATFEEHSG